MWKHLPRAEIYLVVPGHIVYRLANFLRVVHVHNAFGWNWVNSGNIWMPQKRKWSKCHNLFASHLFIFNHEIWRKKEEIKWMGVQYICYHLQVVCKIKNHYHSPIWHLIPPNILLHHLWFFLFLFIICCLSVW